MIPTVFEVETEGLFTVRDERRFNALFKQALQAMLFEWQRRYFDQHFSRTAFFRYPGVYTKRQGRRQAAKKRRRKRPVAQGRPNFKSGRMMRELDQSFRVRGTVKEMTATMRGPDYTDIRGKVDKALEITFVSDLEAAALARFMETGLAQLFRKTKMKRRLRIAA